MNMKVFSIKKIDDENGTTYSTTYVPYEPGDSGIIEINSTVEPTIAPGDKFAVSFTPIVEEPPAEE